jgi:hypothetical protein
VSDASTLDVAIVVLVVGTRFFVPLLIPLFPLPVMIAALVIDAADQTIFQTYLTPHSWSQIEDGYQGYDKSLDIYYLSIAYVATMRNWTNSTALVTAQFLWLYRLFGVTLFEVIHDPSDPSSWRWLLLVFPNTFEYFFDAYEAIRLRWNPLRMSPRLVLGIAAFIWIFIKLPQEWWIHVAQLDFTDELAAHGWLGPLCVIGILAIIGVAWWAIKYRLPSGDWRFQVKAPPLPAELAAAERASWRAAGWKLFDWNLVEKVFFVGLVCVTFTQIMPDVTLRPTQTIAAVALLVTVNASMGLFFAHRGLALENLAAHFVVQLAINIGIVWLMHLVTNRYDPSDAVFFILLITLIVVLYDRYRPVREYHRRPDAPAYGRGAAS